MKLQQCVKPVIAAIVLSMCAMTVRAQLPAGVSEEQLKTLLSSIDSNTDHFAKTADKALDKSGYDGTAREDELNIHLKNFRYSSKNLRKNYGTPMGQGAVEEVLRKGVAIGAFLKQNPLDGVEGDWSILRTDLQNLARVYGINMEDPRYATGARVAEGDVRNLLYHLEDMADKYKLSLDAALDNSVLNNTTTEDEINRINSEFRASTRHLEDTRENGGAQSAAQDVLVKAKRIDGFLQTHKQKLTPEVQSDWAAVRSDVEKLARLYSLKWGQ
jgi:hypothetical protein